MCTCQLFLLSAATENPPGGSGWNCRVGLFIVDLVALVFIFLYTATPFFTPISIGVYGGILRFVFLDKRKTPISRDISYFIAVYRAL